MSHLEPTPTGWILVDGDQPDDDKPLDSIGGLSDDPMDQAKSYKIRCHEREQLFDDPYELFD